MLTYINIETVHVFVYDAVDWPTIPFTNSPFSKRNLALEFYFEVQLM